MLTPTNQPVLQPLSSAHHTFARMTIAFTPGSKGKYLNNRVEKYTFNLECSVKKNSWVRSNDLILPTEYLVSQQAHIRKKLAH